MSVNEPKRRSTTQWAVQAIGQTWNRQKDQPVAGWVDDFYGSEEACRTYFKEQKRLFPLCRFRILRSLTTYFVEEMHEGAGNDDDKQLSLSYEREAEFKDRS